MKVRVWGLVIEEWPGGSLRWQRHDVSYGVELNLGAGAWPPERKTRRWSHLVQQVVWIGPLCVHRQKVAA